MRSVALWWTQSEILSLAEEVLGGDVGRASVHKHLESLLRNKADATLGAELRSAVEGALENYEAAVHRKMNAIYAAQAKRLETEFIQVQLDLEAKAPMHQQRLDRLNSQLESVSERYDNWLDEPQRNLESLLSFKRQEFTDKIDQIIKAYEAKTKSQIKKIDTTVEKIIDARLHALVLSAVREHVASCPFEVDGLSNRQLAAAHGISLRRVKRLRRQGLA